MPLDIIEVFTCALSDLRGTSVASEARRRFKKARGSYERMGRTDVVKLANVITQIEDEEELKPDCKSRRLLRNNLKTIRRYLEAAVYT